MALVKHLILSSFATKPMPQAIFLFKVLELKSLAASLLILKGFFKFLSICNTEWIRNRI